jgi:hypothetical protein
MAIPKDILLTISSPAPNYGFIKLHPKKLSDMEVNFGL